MKWIFHKREARVIYQLTTDWLEVNHEVDNSRARFGWLVVLGLTAF